MIIYSGFQQIHDNINNDLPTSLPNCSYLPLPKLSNNIDKTTYKDSVIYLNKTSLGVSESTSLRL